MRGGYIRKLRLFRRLIVFNCCYFVFFISKTVYPLRIFSIVHEKKILAKVVVRNPCSILTSSFISILISPPNVFIFSCKTDIFSWSSLLWQWIGTQDKTSQNILTRVYSSYFFRRLYLGETSAGLMDIDFWKFSLCFCFHLYLKWFTTHLFIINISYRHWQSSPRATKLPQN